MVTKQWKKKKDTKYVSWLTCKMPLVSHEVFRRWLASLMKPLMRSQCDGTAWRETPTEGCGSWLHDLGDHIPCLPTHQLDFPLPSGCWEVRITPPHILLPWSLSQSPSQQWTPITMHWSLWNRKPNTLWGWFLTYVVSVMKTDSHNVVNRAVTQLHPRGPLGHCYL